MVGVIDGFRWCILGDPLHWNSFISSCIIVLIFLIIGVIYFRKMEKSFADNI
jgi:lipopolysaccharide transport system permease protein